MFVLFPYRVDTHCAGRPWGTIGLIAVNCAVVLLLGFASDALPHAAQGVFIDKLILEFGTLNPLTWLTSAFVHFDWMHLIFNMLFLWAFGFIVEGYLGSKNFLLLYLVLVLAEGAVTQILMIGAEGGGSAGASGVITGLMAISALWAPRNTLTLFVWFVVIIRNGVEVTVLKFCAIWIGLDLLSILLGGFAMSSELLHSIGGALGLGAGVICLRNHWVETDGWDYLSIRKHGDPRYQPTVVKQETDRAPEMESMTPSVRARGGIQEALKNGDARRAAALHESAPADFQLPLAELRALIAALFKQDCAREAVPHMEEFLQRKPDDGLRIRLAATLVDLGRARAALDHLAMIESTAQTDEILRRANERLASGSLELE